MQQTNDIKGQSPFYRQLYILHFCLIFILSSLTLEGQSSRNAIELRGAEADMHIQGTKYVKEKPGSVLPDFVRFAENEGIPVENFFNWLQGNTRANQDYSFVQQSTTKDNLGMVHYFYEMQYRGVAVDNSRLTLHTKDNRVISFNALTPTAGGAPLSPTLTPEEALEHAKRFVGAEKYMWEDEQWESELKQRKNDPQATYYPAGKLVIIPSVVKDSEPGLGYRFDIAALSPMQYIRVCVDAITGDIFYDVPMESNCVAANVNTIFNGNRGINTELYTDDEYRLRDDCSAAVVYVRDWNSNNLTPNPTEIDNTTNTWTTTNEIFGGTVLWETKRAYAYFLNRFGRNSYDDANGDVSALINALFDCSPPPMCTTANNASMSFSGGNMKVGLSNAGVLTNSYATIDIIGHEYAHAVTGATAMLVYEDEWGALNESFSDIFGEAIENFALGSNDWLMGSERDNGAIRSLSNPNAGSDPDTYLGTNWVTITPPCDGSNDECGVHTNSGVQNFWFYLLTVGGSGTNDNGDDYEVTGIGLQDAEAIAYRNLVTYLGANSDYSDARAGAIQAAIDLFGECSQQHESTMDAWYAVGVGDPFLTAEATVTSDYNGRDISCFGASDGEATAVATFGTPDYLFDWSNEASGAVNAGLPAGNYIVTVTDDNGCTATASVTLENPPLLTAGISITSDYNGWPISCAGACDGSAQAIPAGGTPPHTYEWGAFSEDQTAQEATGLCAGDHFVTVTDANGCTATAQVTLTEPPPLEVEAGDNQTIFYWDINLACTALMASDESGGVPPYTYEWSSGGTDASEEVCLDMREDTVTTVTYYITLTDANGCEAIDSLEVCYVDINCGKGGATKVFICHFPPDNPLNPQTLCVSLNALPDHLSHGDGLMYCGFVSPCNPEPMARIQFPETNVFTDEAPGGHTTLDVFPNPFSGTTTVRVRLSATTQAELQLYRLDGSLISGLFKGDFTSGEMKEIQISSEDLAPGVYFLRLRSETGEVLNKRVLVY